MNAARFYRRAFELMPAREGGAWQPDGSPAEAPTIPSADDLETARPALEEMHRGAAVVDCDWELPRSNAGFMEEMTLQARVRRLVELSSLRAGVAFQEGRDRDAFADVLAMLALARHLGTAGFYISGLVQFAVEAIAIAAAAPFVPRLDQTMLDEVMARLDALPSPFPLADAVLAERTYFIAAAQAELATASPAELPQHLRNLSSPEEVDALLALTGGDRQRLLALVAAAGAHVEELARIYRLPFDQIAPGVAAFLAAHEAANPFVGGIARHSEQMRPPWEKATVMRALFRTALACASGGIGEVGTVPDPFGNGPFAYRPLAGGFELASRYQALAWEAGQMVFGPVRLRIGTSA